MMNRKTALEWITQLAAIGIVGTMIYIDAKQARTRSNAKPRPKRKRVQNTAPQQPTPSPKALPSPKP